MPLSWGKPHLEPLAAKHSKPDLDLLGQIAPGQGLTLHGWPRGANPEMARKAVFLGGTHSVRPHCEAVPMPRHNMIIGAKRTPGGLMARSPGGGKTSPAGVRSPPLRGVGYPS
jgi:hypothetical protein